MADEVQKDSVASGELASKDDIFSGPIELPGDDKSAEPELPVKAVENGNDAGSLPGKSEDSGDFNFQDLINKAPEELKAGIKAAQAHLTRKSQTYAEKVKALEANQLTDNLKSDFSKLYDWYNKIQQNPKAGLKELASQYGVSVKDLVEASEAARPTTEELTLEQVKANPTAENWAAFTRQEVRNALEELRDKEVKPLQETFSKMKESSVRQGHVQRGSEALKDAIDTLPGFTTEVEGKKVLSNEAFEAIDAVVKRGEYAGPNALKNAFKSIIAEKSVSQAKEWETKFADLKKSIVGASNPPGGPAPKTITPPMTGNIEDRWARLRDEPLSP
jgi:hypothetical protein